MNPFWNQSSKKFPKEDILEELYGFMKPFDIKMLPSFPSLKWVFKEMNRESIINQINHKTEKCRKRLWEHNKFDKKLKEKINSKGEPEELDYWAGVFLEYYKSMKSETKND